MQLLFVGKEKAKINLVKVSYRHKYHALYYYRKFPEPYPRGNTKKINILEDC